MDPDNNKEEIETGKDACECQKEFEEKLSECKKQSEEYLNGWKRARADYLNYRNEEADRIAGLLQCTREDVVGELLPILDNFNLAAAGLPDNLKNDANIQGLLKIKTQLEYILKSYGVEEIKSLGEKFDPNVHEIVAEVEAEGREPGTVAEVVKNGYRINHRLLRPAKVKIVK